MGNKVSSATHSTATAGIDSYVAELGDITYERSLGSARFMKTIRGRHKDGLVVVKIFVKPEPGLSLKTYVKTRNMMLSPRCPTPSRISGSSRPRRRRIWSASISIAACMTGSGEGGKGNWDREPAYRRSTAIFVPTLYFNTPNIKSKPTAHAHFSI
ncbi:hypothetical protein BC938DRAFT_476587 [Jimgerdemannia flammicorona]|uniref:Protein kinase domain-containing protein n=1 Tax=Jimgerdemannia flammicorona TaxID=994334 RepID=A0A433QZ29_9FUNG|nr:hypothetical protein BC938DRAFT_476587 [Jimgerdemannia flammicorona]